jgi:hypothetical protein
VRWRDACGWEWVREDESAGSVTLCLFRRMAILRRAERSGLAAGWGQELPERKRGEREVRRNPEGFCNR